MASSNTDVDGLKTIHSEAKQISQIFFNAAGILMGVSTPTGGSSGYKQAIKNCLRMCTESAINLDGEIKRYINEMENANNDITLMVDAFGEDSSWLGPTLPNAKETDKEKKIPKEDKGGFWADIGDFFTNLGENGIESIDKLGEEALSKLDKAVQATGELVEYIEEDDVGIGTKMVNILGGIYDSAMVLGADVGDDVINLFADVIAISDKEAAEKIEDFGEILKDKARKAAEEKTGARNVASGFNLIIGAGVGGTLKTLEGIWDSLRMYANISLEAQLMQDAYSLPGALNTDVREIYLEAAEDVRESRDELMADTAKSYSDEIMSEKFYGNEDIASINDLAYDEAKYGGEAYVIAEGIFQSVSTELLATIPYVGLGVKYLAVAGDTTEDTLNKMRLNSKDGIREAYEAGEISQKDYEWCEEIWNMSDEEFYQIRVEKVSGCWTDEEYEKMLQIRNMQEEWKTQENFYGANAVGAVVGVIETAQSAVGKATNAIEGAGGVTARITSDLGLSAIEQPIRNLATAEVMGTNFFKEFKDDGGIKGYLINVGVDFAGSFADEMFDFAKARKNSNSRPQTSVDGIKLGKDPKMEVDTGKTPKMEVDTGKTPKAEIDTGRTTKAEVGTGKTSKVDIDENINLNTSDTLDSESIFKNSRKDKPDAEKVKSTTSSKNEEKIRDLDSSSTKSKYETPEVKDVNNVANKPKQDNISADSETKMKSDWDEETKINDVETDLSTKGQDVSGTKGKDNVIENDGNRKVETDGNVKVDEEVKPKVDVNKRVEYDIESPEFNAEGIEGMKKRLEYGEQKMQDFFVSHPNAGVTDIDVTSRFQKAKLYETNAEFEERIIATGYDESLGPTQLVGAYYYTPDGTFNYRPYNTVVDGVHEINHSLGEVRARDRDLDISNPDSKYRALNEAHTEYLALKIVGDTSSGGSGYKLNVQHLRNLYSTLEKYGYTDIDIGYFNNSINPYALTDTLREITGSDEFFDKFAENMCFTEMR